MTSDPHSRRPARPDEVEPSDAMREADRANGEPAATEAGEPSDARERTPRAEPDDEDPGAP